ncbi:unnamed protein product [Sphacelaria rigidula]
MLDELQSIKNHEVSDIIPASSVPSNNSIIGTRWVFKVKADGRFEARLVVQGWSQRHGPDCGSTFAPVCRLETKSVTSKFEVTGTPVATRVALDVQTAFLNVKLQETALCRQPPGFETFDLTTGEPQVMRLKRALYGLRQSPNVWNDTMDTELRKMFFLATASDLCVYTKGSHEGYVMLTLYVDDVLMTGSSISIL